jgi:hypothetical protein
MFRGVSSRETIIGTFVSQCYPNSILDVSVKQVVAMKKGEAYHRNIG